MDKPYERTRIKKGLTRDQDNQQFGLRLVPKGTKAL